MRLRGYGFRGSQLLASTSTPASAQTNTIVSADPRPARHARRKRQPIMDISATTELAPRLVVSDGDAALAFYAAAFDSEPSDQIYDGARLVNGHVLIGTTLVGVTEEDGSYNRSPTTIGGTPVILSLTVPDADLAAARFLEAGGELVIPVDDRPYGRRDGRLKDPFGHLWILGQPLS